MRMLRGAVVVVGVLGLLASTSACAAEEEPLVVSAAASLTDVLPRIGERFAAGHDGPEIVYDFAGSSTLAEQIRQGSPSDVFVSADVAVMDQLADVPAVGEPVVVASNVLQVAVPPGNPAGVTGLADFGRPELRLVACAPEVPCGSAAEQVFAAAGVTPALDSEETDVRAVVTKVGQDEADAGLVYRTDVIAAGGRVEGVDVAEAAAVVNEYPAAPLTGGAHPEEGRQLVEFLTGPEAQQLLAEAGFGPP
ncbi:molybdate ABC transporter substrate-binding protein [Desertihabitans brevis]|uniref:Molybdate ABC transporter substrate-binding protein n=1 Tax=Desertihabitans brevis TaxID=2268447 RepID=A0A367YXQ5_9ACTN|nr:molybdate ABC transporter substrate-binding protein [Desertihabitans brevis]RCK69721.1 molybdate ABC transporter substrate-binding protein [Desertihabitans brevis]